MKKYLNLVLVVLFTTFFIIVPANAQKRNVGKEAQKLSYGAKAGFNIASLTSSEDQSRIGLCIGVFGEYKVRKDFGISVDLLYSQQGAENEVEGIAVGLLLDYLNIPILANLELFDGLSVKAGLQPGFLLSSKFYIAGISVDYDDANSIDFSIPIGLSYTFDFGVLIDVRYNLGLTKVADELSDKNSVFQITLGYKF